MHAHCRVESQPHYGPQHDLWPQPQHNQQECAPAVQRMLEPPQADEVVGVDLTTSIKSRQNYVVGRLLSNNTGRLVLFVARPEALSLCLRLIAVVTLLVQRKGLSMVWQPVATSGSDAESADRNRDGSGMAFYLRLVRDAEALLQGQPFPSAPSAEVMTGGLPLRAAANTDPKALAASLLNVFWVARRAKLQCSGQQSAEVAVEALLLARNTLLAESPPADCALHVIRRKLQVGGVDHSRVLYAFHFTAIECEPGFPLKWLPASDIAGRA